MIKQIPKEQWYFDAFTWRGIDEKGVSWYPVSYDNDGTAWRTTNNINGAMTFNTESRAREMIKISLAKDCFFQHRYKTIEIVKVKEYPTGWFDFYKSLSQLNIQIPKKDENNIKSTEDKIEYLKENYGYVCLEKDENKIIEISNDKGASFQEKCSEYDKSLEKIHKMNIEDSVFPGTTFLVKTYADIKLLSLHIPGLNHLADEFNNEEKCFITWTGDIKLPCFIICYNDEHVPYSIEEVEEIVTIKANKMLKIIEKLKSKEKSK